MPKKWSKEANPNGNECDVSHESDDEIIDENNEELTESQDSRGSDNTLSESKATEKVSKKSSVCVNQSTLLQREREDSIDLLGSAVVNNSSPLLTQLDDHKLSHSYETDGKYVCDYKECGKSFDTELSLENTTPIGSPSSCRVSGVKRLFCDHPELFPTLLEQQFAIASQEVRSSRVGTALPVRTQRVRLHDAIERGVV